MLRTALYADRAPVLEQDFLNGEAFANLHAGLSRGVDEQLVEDRAPWAIRDRCFPCARRAGEVKAPKSKA